MTSIHVLWHVQPSNVDGMLKQQSKWGLVSCLSKHRYLPPRLDPSVVPGACMKTEKENQLYRVVF